MRVPALALLLAILWCSRSAAQVDNVFNDIFDTILDERLASEVLTIASFDKAAEEANAFITPVLNDLIDHSVSSLPITSTIAGVTFDLTSGVPVMNRENLGPIFSETASTVGRRKLAVGINHSIYRFDALRGLKTSDARFTFMSADLNESGLIGDDDFETETIDVYPGFQIDVGQTVFFATYGVTDRVDVGFALPWITLSMEGTARAVINSTSLFRYGVAFNSFNGLPEAPQLETEFPYSENASGLGDVAARIKYVLIKNTVGRSNGGMQGIPFDLALLVETRLPVKAGSDSDFLRLENPAVRTSLAGSRDQNGLSVHVNVGYELRSENSDSDKLQLFVGLERSLTRDFGLAVDFYGLVDVEETNVVFPDATELHVHPDGDFGMAETVIRVERTNIEERSRDNLYALSVGFKAIPTERLSFMANMFVALNDAGLRSPLVPTFGISTYL